MFGYEALADALAQEGTEHIFTVCASDNMDLLIELKDKKAVKVISARKEAGAAGMADGYSRATGRPGICCVTLGPGLTNAATSLMTANRHKSPVLCITTERSRLVRKSVKGLGLDQQHFAEDIGGKYIRVGHGRTLAEDVQSAFRHIRSAGGSVVLALPQEVMKGKLDIDWRYSPVALSMPQPQRSYPDPVIVAQAVATLSAAGKPVIITGRGAASSQAEQEAASLAERTGALVATTLMARGFLAHHPYNAGISGPFALETIQTLLSQADCVLAVGCSLNSYTVGFGSLYAKAQIIHIDQDPAQIGAVTPVAVGMVGDARASLTAISLELDRRQVGKKQGFWHSDVKALIAKSRSEAPPYVEERGRIDPNQLVAELDRVLPGNRIMALDGGHHRYFPAGRISLSEACSFIWSADLGVVGLSLYQGIGAAIGRPDRHVVVFVGDGGFMMSLEELDTAVRYHVPVTVVIMNDNAFGAEMHHLASRGRPIDITLFDDNPDFAPVATALGAVGLTVRNAEDIQSLAATVARANLPVLIDAKVNRNVAHRIEAFQLKGRGD
ncbi:MAG: thiamine pyrophosphate-binding protein [Chloroflexi bacterium]|nr:thiamine pyrophosphate-binding protein [Chloroflexota bacterium]